MPTPYWSLAYDLTLQCDRQPAERVKVLCRAIDPGLQRAALQFFFRSDEWRRHRRLWKAIAGRWAEARSMVGTSCSAPAGRHAAALQDGIGPSLDTCTEALAERFRHAAG